MYGCWDGGSSCTRGSQSSSAQKLERSAGRLLNKWGERALFFPFFFNLLSPFTLSFCLFFCCEKRSSKCQAFQGHCLCLVTLSAEEWLLWMGTVVTWPCCRISLKQKHLHIHAKCQSQYNCYSVSWYNGTYSIQVLLLLKTLGDFFFCSMNVIIEKQNF